MGAGGESVIGREFRTFFLCKDDGITHLVSTLVALYLQGPESLFGVLGELLLVAGPTETMKCSPLCFAFGTKNNIKKDFSFYV